HEEHGQFPNAGEVEAFVKRAVVYRAIAEKCDADVFRLEQLETVTRARSLQDARTDDAARAHHSNFRREEVHAPTASTGATCGATIEFGEKQPRIEAFAERVAVAAMCAEDRVLALQMRAYANSDGLLPDISVTGAVNQSTLVRFRKALFAQADELHL